MANEHQKLIEEILKTRPIAFNADLANALGSAKAGLLLSQLLYWHEKGFNPEWTYKTIEEMKKETALSRDEQKTAIKICEKFGVLEKKIMGIPARRHFKVNMKKITELLNSNIKENTKQAYGKTTNKFARIQQTNTDNTTKNTNREISSSKKKAYFRGEEMRWSQNKWWVIPKEGGSWLEFAGEKKDIEWR